MSDTLIYKSQLDLKSYNISQLRNMATHLHIKHNVPKNDLTWLIAIALYSKYIKAGMHVKVDYGQYSDNLHQINEQYHNIVDRFQQLADEAGVGTAAPHRHFDGASFIQYAIDNNITHLDIDDIYVRQINDKIKDAEKEFAIEYEQEQKSKSGKRCISLCKTNEHGDCYCDTEPYRGWTGTYYWDYCNSNDCKSVSDHRPIARGNPMTLTRPGEAEEIASSVAAIARERVKYEQAIDI